MIEIENLHKRFDTLEVLKGVDLTIERGQCVVIIGQSGSGKSVLLKHIVRLLLPDKGRVVIDGTDILELKHSQMMRFRRKIGFLFQFGALFDSMTVGENIGFELKETLRLRKAEIAEKVQENLALVGLSGIEDKMPSDISGGMRKRVALARAIASRPAIMLYDEPTTGLDPITADKINELIVGINRELNVTSIAVTHDMASAYKIANRIVMLYDGKFVCDNPPEEIKRTDNDIVRQFINGSSTGPIQVV
jgi:phospholipid/cholesterol/gamma-HCH transport system ATP-binding protein